MTNMLRILKMRDQTLQEIKINLFRYIQAINSNIDRIFCYLPVSRIHGVPAFGLQDLFLYIKSRKKLVCFRFILRSTFFLNKYLYFLLHHNMDYIITNYFDQKHFFAALLVLVIMVQNNENAKKTCMFYLPVENFETVKIDYYDWKNN